MQAAYKTLNRKIEEDSRNVTSVQSSVDAINRTLSVFGFRDFRVVRIENNCYQIMRQSGELARDTLSEGEVTFLTFLYFMQLVRGALTPKKIDNHREVVFDDPISGLDSTTLFAVIALIKEEISALRQGHGNVEQIIVLTHNIAFHKALCFEHGKVQSHEDMHFWILRKENGLSHAQAFATRNPVLGFYELLWEELKHGSLLSAGTVLTTMRRQLRTYFQFFGEDQYQDLPNKFQTQQDREICRSLLRWTGDDLHCATEDVTAAEDLKLHYYRVFEKIFTLLNNQELYLWKMGSEHAAQPAVK